MFRIVSVVFFVCWVLMVEAAVALDPNDPKWAWMDRCIEKELAGFRETGITKDMLDKVMRNASRISFAQNLHRFTVIKGKVYGEEGPYEPKRLLETLIQLYPIPDVDLILFTQDIIWNPWDLVGPVLATCRDDRGSAVILFPIQLWSAWEDRGRFVEPVNQASAESPWESKIEKIFWRGGANTPTNLGDPTLWTSFDRGNVCMLSKQFPQFIDATFTAAYPWMFNSDLQRQDFFTLFPIKSASWEEYISHKYLIDLDGYVASTPGYAWKLLTNCVVFKRDTGFKLWFYPAVKPWVHYIPWDGSSEDLFKKLQWAKDHDAEAKTIAGNGRTFAQENLLPEHAYLYCYKLLKKYASMQKFKPSIRP